MNRTQLRAVMKYHLKNFASSDIEVTDDTVHNEILSENDGTGTATSKRIYRSFIRWTIIRAGNEDKAWPNKWIDLSVTALSEKLI